MFGHTFKCCECGAEYHAGITYEYKTERVPGITLLRAGDERGYWVIGPPPDYKHYCGPCSDKGFPQITEPGLDLKHIGTICF